MRNTIRCECIPESEYGDPEIAIDDIETISPDFILEIYFREDHLCIGNKKKQEILVHTRQ